MEDDGATSSAESVNSKSDSSVSSADANNGGGNQINHDENNNNKPDETRDMVARLSEASSLDEAREDLVANAPIGMYRSILSYLGSTIPSSNAAVKKKVMEWVN